MQEETATELTDLTVAIEELRCALRDQPTKREMFAAMAMQGILASGIYTNDEDAYAINAVWQADALIAALEGGGK